MLKQKQITTNTLRCMFMYCLLSMLCIAFSQAQNSARANNTTSSVNKGKATSPQLPNKKTNSKIDSNKIAANSNSRAKSVGWIKSSIDKTNETLAKSDNVFDGKNSASRTEQGAKLLKQYSYDAELDNNPTEQFALVPLNILDFVEINKNIKDKRSKNRSKDLNTIAAFFKRSKLKVKKGWTWNIDFSGGYTSNFAEILNSVGKYNDTPVSVSMNNITTSMKPFTIGLGYASPQKRYLYALHYSYFLTNNIAFLKRYADTITYGGEKYIYSSAFKPKINLSMLSLDMYYFFQQYMVAGRDLFKLYGNLGVDLYYLNYQDRVRITTSNITQATGVNGEEKVYLTDPVNYYQDFDRTFAPMYLVGGHLGFGATARITKGVTSFLETQYLFSIPFQEESVATRIVNLSYESTSGISWVAAPTKIRLGYGQMFNLKVGIRCTL